MADMIAAMGDRVLRGQFIHRRVIATDCRSDPAS
jgi:hypothetical protein